MIQPEITTATGIIKEDDKTKNDKTLTMYIAYSALPLLNRQRKIQQPETLDNNLQIRYNAYLATCEKYRHEIAAIQKYIPGWQPAFQLK